jgi:8-oxo-dGTP pyrophosphatase MutT (NUDIX family)
MSQTATPASPRLSATILLLRDEPQFEVLMVKRHHQIDFASGALVFPGGKTEAADADPTWSEHCADWSDYEPDERILRIAALREAFEEAGILLVAGSGGLWSDEADVMKARVAVERGELAFLDLVKSLDVRLNLSALTRFARWITPVMMPKRFDTHFFLAVAPADQLAICDGRETVDAEWVAPQEALALAETGQRTIIFPTRMNLKLLGESAASSAAVDAARQRPEVTVTPWVEQRPSGSVLVIPPDAGYGAVEEDLASVGA